MAVVQLADVYNPLIFNPAVQESAVEQNMFLNSGVMVTDPLITAMANGPGTIGELPFFFGLGNPQADGTNEPDYVTDDPDSDSVPSKITGDKMTYRKAQMAKSWSTMDLARELALLDPLGAIINRIGHYWAVNNQVRLIRSALGLLADNVANDSGDMLFSIATDAVGAPAAAELISPDAVIAAKSTMGDAANSLAVIAMHSVVFSELQRQEVIIYEKAAGTNIKIPTYLGYIVVVDDSMPAVAGTNRITYTTVLFGTGAIGSGTGTPVTPSELDRKAAAGDGGGQDIIHSRATEIIHPGGFAFLSAVVAGQSASFAELANALNWNRVYEERKNIPMAFLQTNG